MMKKLKLTRFYDDLETTLGCLTCEELAIPLFTCEKSWRFNQSYISCIPKGIYKIKPHKSPKNGKCFEVKKVPKRTHIQIHSANLSSQLEGCIAVGLQAGTLKNKPAVLKSRKAMRKLKKLILNDEWELEII